MEEMEIREATAKFQVIELTTPTRKISIVAAKQWKVDRSGWQPVVCIVRINDSSRCHFLFVDSGILYSEDIGIKDEDFQVQFSIDDDEDAPVDQVFWFVTGSTEVGGDRSGVF